MGEAGRVQRSRHHKCLQGRLDDVYEEKDSWTEADGDQELEPGRARHAGLQAGLHGGCSEVHGGVWFHVKSCLKYAQNLSLFRGKSGSWWYPKFHFNQILFGAECHTLRL